MTVYCIIMEKYKGSEFNNLHKNKIFYKLTNESENHNGFQFVDGINIDTFGRGFCFTDRENMKYWFDYNHNGVMMYYREIIIPDDASVFAYDNEYKTDKIILRSKYNIWDNDDMCKDILKECGAALQYIKNQTVELCEIAVLQNGSALEYVNKEFKTYRICKMAVCQNRHALQYVDPELQTEKICEIALLQKEDVFEHIHKKSLKLCEIAILQKGSIIDLIDDQTAHLCELAVYKDGNAIQYIKNITPTIAATIWRTRAPTT